jgi:hypothetical protein
MSTLKKALLVLVALALGTVAGTAAQAGDASASSSDPSARHHPSSPTQALNGTWLTTVQLTDAPPGAPTSFNALDTFLPDGGLLVSSSAPNPAQRGLAHGSWSHVGHRNFTSTFVWFRFDAPGQAIGTQRVHRTMKVSTDGSSFTATDIIEIVAPTGAVLVTIHGTETGQLLPG